MIETLICAGDDPGSCIRLGLLIGLHRVSGVFGAHVGAYIDQTQRPARLRYCRHHATFFLFSDCNHRCLVVAGQGSFYVPALFELSHRPLQPFAFSLNAEPRHLV